MRLLDIPESILKDHLIPKDYYKPKIEVRNYYLKWNNESYGVPQKEIPELKKFVTNAIPFFDTSYEVLNNLKPRHRDKYSLDKGSSPRICISHKIKHSHMVRYELHMLSDGSTFIERIEGVEATTPKTNDIIVNPQRHHFKPIFYLKWTLGELLFDRQKVEMH
ncbi:MAG TPA: hypothetical protein VJ729_09405 [Nitrososphaeraceae archaeon]|jgi:hypothetical protein|nr:hypothetical protein [Nitrososphaeraceae archaeon]